MNATARATDLIGISITTKDRWDDLKITLDHLKAGKLDGLETIVIDDGSAVPMPAHFQQSYPWVKFLRFALSEGATTQRNRMARLLSTPLILGLDDDSFPISGDLDQAASWLMDEPEACSLGFMIANHDLAIPPTSPSVQLPSPSKTFVACGCLLKRELFLDLGGYEELLGNYWEEEEFSMRAFQKGYRNFTSPGVIVRHRLAQASRDRGRVVRLMTRNYCLLALWHYPFPFSYLRALRYWLMQIIKFPFFRKQWSQALLGAAQGIASYFSTQKDKRRLTREQFQEWERLKGAHTLLITSSNA